MLEIISLAKAGQGPSHVFYTHAPKTPRYAEVE